MKVLFFTQNLARTGSEVALYNIICNADRRQIKMAVAVGEAGELTKCLPPDVPWSSYLHNDSPSFVQKLSRRVKDKFSPKEPEEWLADFARDYEGYIWYINSIVQPYILRQARKFGVRCVVHSHEMEHMFWNLTEEEVRDIVDYPELVIACSKSSAEVLRQLGRKENLEICYEPVDVKNIVTTTESAEFVRAQLGVNRDTFVWAMSGSLDPNKNPVAFLEVAGEMQKRGLDVHFMWIGGGGKGYRPFVEGKAEALNVSDIVSWVRPKAEDYYDYLNAADAFVLTSFRDSFPLVMIEVAALGKPIVSFKSGGVQEFVLPGMGEVIDSWNVPDLTEAMLRVMRKETYLDPVVSRKQAEEFDVSVQVKHWEAIMEKQLSAFSR
jgi:glycosyltransferase involved in cell wall biosynthesis